MSEYNIDPEKGHKLSAKFARLLSTLRQLLNKCADVNILKEFLDDYSDPMFPEETYVHRSVYEDAKTAGEVISRLKPRYINYIHYVFLGEIIDVVGNDECKKHFDDYVQTFKRSVRKLRHHPAAIADEEIEVSIGQIVLKITRTGDVNATTLQDIQISQEAIERATGIGRMAQVYARQDPAFSVIFTFLIPECVEHRFHELSKVDLNLLADAGITKIVVGELEIVNISQYCTRVKKVLKTSNSISERRETNKPTSLEYYVNEQKDLSSQEKSQLILKLKSKPEKQLNEMCSELQILRLSKSIQNWRNLAPYLGMLDSYFEEFTTKYPEIKEQNYQLFVYWRQRYPNSTYYHILETVILHGTADEVKAIIGIPFEGE